MIDKTKSINLKTGTQVGLTAAQRKKNVDGAFRADPYRLVNQSILIVNDMTTSAAAIKACGPALVNFGHRQVYTVTLARAFQTNNEF